MAGQCVERTLGQIDACLAERPQGVIVDLCATEPTRFVIALLGLVRRRAERWKTPMVLAAPEACRDLLEEVQVASLYSVHPTLDSALEAFTEPSTPEAVAALEALAARPARTGRRS